jgi:hypothetical protein
MLTTLRKQRRLSSPSLISAAGCLLIFEIGSQTLSGSGLCRRIQRLAQQRTYRGPIAKGRVVPRSPVRLRKDGNIRRGKDSTLVPMFAGAKRAFPGTVFQLKVMTGRLYDVEVQRLVLEHGKSRVIDGPFRGMRYLDRANCSALTPKLLGTYERELHPFVQDIIDERPSHVIDVGSAEGYYAVGFALSLPHATVHAFDIDSDARRNVAALADLNGVTARVSIERECAFDTFKRFTGTRFVVICDIEGAEKTLLDPASAPALTSCDILVEIHDGNASTAIHDAFRDRFSNSHEMTFVRYAGRSAKDAAGAPWLGHPHNKLRAVEEGRTFGLEWGYFRSRARVARRGTDRVGE